MIPKLSIIVPTKNRNETATLTCTKLSKIFEKELAEGSIEILIYDTGDSNELENYLTNIKILGQYSTFRYIKNNESGGFCEDFNNAIDSATGDFITIIGDDDLISHLVLDLVRWANENSVDSICCKNPALYYWDSFEGKYSKQSQSSSLVVLPYTGKMEYPDLRYEVNRCADSGFQYFVKLPKVYYGLVKKSTLQKLKLTHGKYFFGSSPDISGALSIASFVKRHVFYDFPIFLPGFSAKSGSGKSGKGTHVGSLESDGMTKGFVNSWPLSLPRMFSVQTVWAHSAIRTLEVVDKFNVLQRFNEPVFFSKLIFFNAKQYKTIFSEFVRIVLKNSKKNSVMIVFQTIFYFMLYFIERSYMICLKLLKYGPYAYVLEQKLISISDASDLIKNFLPEKLDIRSNFGKEV